MCHIGVITRIYVAACHQRRHMQSRAVASFRKESIVLWQVRMLSYVEIVEAISPCVTI